MGKVQLQFHVEPDEALRLAEGWAEEIGAQPVVEQNFPEYRVVVADQGKIAGSAQSLERADRVALCRRSPVVAATSPQEFASKNPDCLFLSIGRLTSEGLRESALSGASTDPDTLQAWRALLRRARAGMHKGAVVENPVSGASQAVPGHGHTPGAHSLAEEGVAMLASAGWNRYLFEDCAVGDVSR